MYETDRGIEELERRQGTTEVSLAWVAAQLRAYVDVHPEAADVADGIASWLARIDDDVD